METEKSGRDPGESLPPPPPPPPAPSVRGEINTGDMTAAFHIESQTSSKQGKGEREGTRVAVDRSAVSTEVR